MLSRAQLATAWPVGTALARRIVLMALVLCAAGVPILPLNEMKVAGTLLCGCVLMVGAYVWLRAGEPVGHTALDLPAGAFLLVAAAATAFGVHPRVSFWPNITRGEGLLDYIVYVPAALAAARLTRLEIREVLAVLLGAGALISAIGVAQYYGFDATPWLGSRFLNYGLRSWGTLANPDFMGGYAALVLPVGVAMAAGAAEPRQWFGYAGAAALLFAALVGSQTRSAWLGAALGAAILAWTLPRTARTYRRLAVLALACAAIAAAMILTRPQAAVSARAAEGINPAQSMAGRLWIWEHTVPLIRERPLLGWGFSAILGHLPGIGSPSYTRVFGTRPLLIDAAHNDILQTTVNAGLLGLAAYLWVWATAVRAAHGGVRAPASPVRPEAAGLLAGLGAYFVWLQFLWSHIGTANVFWVLAGLSVALGRAATAGADVMAAGGSAGDTPAG